MTMSEERFPDDIAYGSAGGPVFSTGVVTNAGGFEKRNSHWEVARGVYNVAHGVKSKAQLDTLIAFFRARKGRAQAFRFKDWSDYQAVAQVIGVGNGTRTTFQLVKTYVSGSNTDTRIITKPVAGTITMYLGNMLQTSGVNVNVASGLVTFNAPPANEVIVKAHFEFDVSVRFETDQLIAQLDDYGLYSWGEIPLVEVRG